jgi:hypothetical protein
VDVINFPRWRVHFYVDDLGRNVIRQWLYKQDISDVDRSALQSLIDICECSGPQALSYCTEDLGNGFYCISNRRKGGPELALVYCLGPVGDSEITVLAAALIDEQGDLKPGYVVGIAQENLSELQKDPRRWRREPVT